MNKILYLLIIFFAISCSSNQIIINEEGKVGKGHLKNNLKSGKWIFSKDDKINSSGNYSKNKKNGNWKYYYPNGKLHQKGKYIDDKQNGIWKYYFDSGELMGSGELLENKQIGLWKWLHKNGRLYTERIYNDGKLIEIKSCFDKNGKILDCGKIINGNGKMLFHHIENETEVIEEFEFEKGIIKN
ncbi:toxin-antitoxin system YwqK family antitoxin [Paenimyroides viscosum]|uniref:Toxin-antitoxin system YwqK family antitoxin n=1 Tax=Paenimyroides viscosum TaxID=2488729 RepID=A0A3P1B2U7_9FLAO|nr:hypothetical protein [Paenimyroides viscosum]RRA95285.1 hypothetical protein EG242_06595 [Paenimyroides viscosum]